MNSTSHAPTCTCLFPPPCIHMHDMPIISWSVPCFYSQINALCIQVNHDGCFWFPEKFNHPRNFVIPVIVGSARAMKFILAFEQREMDSNSMVTLSTVSVKVTASSKFECRQQAKLTTGMFTIAVVKSLEKSALQIWLFFPSWLSKGYFR